MPPTKEKTSSVGAFFSGVDRDSLHWATAMEVARHCLSTVDDLPTGTVLNVNVPNLPLDALAGIRTASLAPFGHVQLSVAEWGEGYVRTTIERSTERLQPGTDVALLAQGFATVTVVTTLREVPAPLEIPPLSTGDNDELGARVA
jgi:5'-nucleotidase